MSSIIERTLVLCITIVFTLMVLPDMASSLVAVQGAQTTIARGQQEEQKRKDKKKGESKPQQKEKGALSSFESEAKNEKADSLRSLRSEESDEDGNEQWWGFLAEITLYATVGGAVGSWYRVTGTPGDEFLEQYFGAREFGEPSIPFAAVNFSYENARSDVDAIDGSVEGGYGPIGMRYRFTRFREKNPDAQLELSWLHGVARLSYTRYLEIGVGFGAIFLNGESRESGKSFTLPIRIEPHEFFGLDYRPAWGWINGNRLSDHDLALRLGVRYVSIRGGYRWTKVGNSTLEGPIFGLLLSY